MNMNEMLKQAQVMQKRMEDVKSEIAGSIFTSDEKRGVVVVMYGTRIVKDVMINDEAMQDKEILQDLIAIATNDCIKQIEEFSEEKLSSIAPGLGGLF